MVLAIFAGSTSSIFPTRTFSCTSEGATEKGTTNTLLTTTRGSMGVSHFCFRTCVWTVSVQMCVVRLVCAGVCVRARVSARVVEIEDLRKILYCRSDA
jgi:hypothetical protein